MDRSLITIDLRALRRNVRRLREAAAPAVLWAVVKADAYGHGAADVARVALAEGAVGLCVATVAEGAELRALAPQARILVMGPLGRGDADLARAAELEVAVSTLDLPDGLPVHLKVDTGMGRWGIPAEQAVEAPRERVVGLMSHLATADEADLSFARMQVERFRQLRDAFPGASAHIANSAATLRLPEARFDAVRCGIALYGISPFGTDPSRDGLAPVLAWHSRVALERTLAPGESTGYGRAFTARRATRIGLVPVGYADGFRRDLGGAEVLVDGRRATVLGRVSMDSFAVALPDGAGAGATVTLIGDGLLAEHHARHLGTIGYEVVCAIRSGGGRATRVVVDG
jgi:alanine racemase